MFPLPPDAAANPQQQQQVIILNTNMANIPSLSSIGSLPSLSSLSSLPALQNLQSQLLLQSLQQSFQQQSAQLYTDSYQRMCAQQQCISPLAPSQPTVFNVSNLNCSNIAPQNPSSSPVNYGISSPNSSLICINLPPSFDMNHNMNPVTNNMSNACGVHNSKINDNKQYSNPMLCTNRRTVQNVPYDVKFNVNTPKLEITSLSLPPEISPIPPAIETKNEKKDIKISVPKNVPVPQPKYGMLKPAVKKSTAAYECELCHKRFKYQSNLISHRRVHRVDCPKCSYCGKKFARKSNLLQHIRIHTNERPYKCTYCPKAFKQKHSLTDHVRSHTGERPFSCEICFKSFAVKHNLIVHKRIHSGEKPYACHICNTNYSSKSGINSHLKHRHQELWAARKAKRMKVKTENK